METNIETKTIRNALTIFSLLNSIDSQGGGVGEAAAGCRGGGRDSLSTTLSVMQCVSFKIAVPAAIAAVVVPVTFE